MTPVSGLTDAPGTRDSGGGLAEVDDRLLAARAADGDDEAFEHLVHRYAPRMLTLATRILGDRTEAEDAVQEAFVAAWRALPGFRADSQFPTWLYRIVTNKCLNLLRARRPNAPLEDAGELRAPAGDPADAAEATETLRTLGQALDSLTDEQRACWVLREMDGLSYEEIGRILGIGEPSVRGRIHRARKALMEAVRPCT
ncbi:sigma-70 family RNA polymerase sigma factor [Catenulispora sp. NF23]|uniref:Sigma-70 family RNA polymerase sigma factor n=1 Tax=Catenulispora pinistramenti TaxID=2705254 RepID=A0ABS5KNI4_9ACTN|nr:sigma-70 family RNA polymerase sigma factor [Catenulispora pinistramenti]MBS2532654.1 sigma-70 family RNA polymerase sigma factor [Catenulispora pinistramenti]MBS2547589.1 sigma-70 family RNA polymerase sigma factor [Catenulispora pinistramenti]